MEDIKKWKENSEHSLAQELGCSKWYKEYTVQIVEVVSAYKRGENIGN